MRRWLALSAALIALILAGFFWTRDRPVAQAAGGQQAALTVPDAETDGEDANLPVPPLAAPRSPLTPAEKEARRFNRYDKDKDNKLSKPEYLANRRKSFDKLDLNHDGVLSFDEYTVKALDKFGKADRDGDGILDREEFATTAIKRRPRAACVCQGVVSAQ